MAAQQGQPIAWSDDEGELPPGSRLRVHFEGTVTEEAALHIDGNRTTAGMVGLKWLRQINARVEVLSIGDGLDTNAVGQSDAP